LNKTKADVIHAWQKMPEQKMRHSDVALVARERDGRSVTKRRFTVMSSYGRFG
jgi:hypothetical protein